MEEKEYIELNFLLTKYRIYCLKKYANIELDSKTRRKAIIQVNHIDAIRKGMDLIIEEGLNKNDVAESVCSEII